MALIDNSGATVPEFHRLLTCNRFACVYGLCEVSVNDNRQKAQRSMATQLTMLCSAATAASRVGAFPARDQPLDVAGFDKARRRSIAPKPAVVLRSPARAAGETAAALGFAATLEDRLADMEFGVWEGRSLAEIHTTQPQELERWIAQPERGAPSGETFDQVRQRIRPWLAAMERTDRRVLAITHAAIVRAVLAEALELPDRSAMRFDIAPLSAVRLSFNREWRMQELQVASFAGALAKPPVEL
jgi:broad specificity phosphatase PhoE